MKRGLAVIVTLSATPAMAHHEVVVATSILPLASGLAAITLAGLAVWRNRVRSRRQKAIKPRG